MSTDTLRAACQLASATWALSGEQVLRLYKQVEKIRKDMEPEADTGIIAEARMQCAHPNVHFHYTDGARVMGALASTVEAIFAALGATTEAEALERVTILQGIAKGDVWVTPRHRRHYAVHSVSGAHVGLWPARETAVEVLRDYPGGTLTELVETGPPNAMPTLSAFVDEHNAVEALRLHVAYEALPTDRGGKNGPKGKAWAAFIAARDKVLTNG